MVILLHCSVRNNITGAMGIACQSPHYMLSVFGQEADTVTYEYE